MSVFALARAFIHLILKDKAQLAAENLALRQQLAIAQQSAKRPKLRRRDKIFWVWLSRLWTKWRTVLAIVQPRDGPPLASAGLQAVLGHEVQEIETARQAQDRS